jgi:hypothetical protein
VPGAAFCLCGGLSAETGDAEVGKSKEEHMADHRVLTGISTALLSVIVLGCAGPAPDIGVGLADSGQSPAPPARLCGTWQGDFSYIGSDHQSSTGASDVMLDVRGDSSYTLRWATNRPSKGTVTAGKNRVILDDESGSRITLVRSGDTLYGVMKDQANGRPTMMSLKKQESASSRFAGTSPRC